MFDKYYIYTYSYRPQAVFVSGKGSKNYDSSYSTNMFLFGKKINMLEF